MVEQVTLLKFGIGWAGLGTTEEGRAQKTLFKKLAYAASRREFGDIPTVEQALDSVEENQDDFEAFKRRYEKVVTVRNRLVNIYKRVWFVSLIENFLD